MPGEGHTLGNLRKISLWAPLLALALLEASRRLLLQPLLGSPLESVLFLGLGAVGIIFFSRWVFGVIGEARAGERKALADARLRYEQLEGLRQASLGLTAELQLSTVLQQVVDLSRRVVKARYGALGVLDDKGKRISRFITSGIREEERRRIGDPPGGYGVLGKVIHSRRALRLDDLSQDPDRIGFPPGHPPMKTFLGVPVMYQDRILGNLYLTEKEEGSFTEQDQEVVEHFAAQAAVAITNARLYERVEELAVLEERERIGMDLHDGTIQSLYALGLNLESLAESVDDDPEGVKEGLNQSVETVGRIIGDIRHYIFDLKLPAAPDEPFRKQVAALVDTLQIQQVVNVNWDWDEDLDGFFTDRSLRGSLLHIFREALTNVVKHAHARNVSIGGRRDEEGIHLFIRDDGAGFDPDAAPAPGRGLTNIQARAASLGARLRLESIPGRGTAVDLWITGVEEAAR